MATTDTRDNWQPFTKSEQASQWVVGLQDHFKQATDVQDVPWQFDRGQLQTSLTPNSFWIIFTFATAGKLAIRTCFDPQTIQSVKLSPKTDTSAEYRIDC